MTNQRKRGSAPDWGSRELSQAWPRMSGPGRRRALGGLLVRRESWGLTFKAKVLALGALMVAGLVGVWTAYPFLAVTAKANSDFLVVEGWVPTATLKEAAAEFKDGHYQHALVVRAVYDIDDPYESGRYSGDYMVNLLVQYGVPRESVVTLFCTVAQQDRTYHSALAVRNWLTEKGMKVKAIDVASVGPHARRSRLLYEKAFGNEVGIGIIALRDSTYDPDHWWRFSHGVRDVTSEAIAYVYARVFFRATNAEIKQEVAASTATGVAQAAR